MSVMVTMVLLNVAAMNTLPFSTTRLVLVAINQLKVYKVYKVYKVKNALYGLENL